MPNEALHLQAQASRAPNNPATICYLIANCGLWLTLRPQDAQACERAAAYLDTLLQAMTIIDPPHIAWLAGVVTRIK